MEQLPQQLVNGLWQGAALSLFAIGYTLVFGLLDIVNLAHGATYAWGAFAALLCVTRLGWPIWLAIPPVWSPLESWPSSSTRSPSNRSDR